MSGSINTNSTSSLDQVMSSIDMGPTDSLSFMYAQLQLAQASICKDQSLEMMDKIQDNQAKQQEVAGMIEEARMLQSHSEQLADNETWPITLDGITYEKSDVNLPYGSIAMSDELLNQFEKYDIVATSPGDTDRHDSEEWDVLIVSLTNYQETLSTSTQTDMVLLQDFMGQYNSYIQGANKAATDGVQTLQSILTR